MTDTPRDWVITTTGKVVRRDKAKSKDVIKERFEFLDTEAYAGPYNSFLTKEDAYTFRDEVIDKYPAAFLPKEEQDKKEESETMPRPQKVLTQEEFQEMMRKEVMKRIDVFWADWSKLAPPDKCALFYKMFAYAFSKAPLAKSIGPDADKAKDDKKRQAAANVIAQGLQQVEDSDFED